MAAFNVIKKFFPYTATVRFDSRGGEPCQPVQVERGSAAGRLPEPSMAHRRFSGWTDSSTGDPVDSSTPFYVDALLAASWTEQASVTFDAGAGSAFPCGAEYYRGEPFGELPGAFRKGYFFAGWRRGSASGDLVAASDSCQGDETLYAAWLRDDGNGTEFEVQTTSSYRQFQIASAAKTSSDPGVAVDWGDGTQEWFGGNVGQATHTYKSNGTFVVKISDTVAQLTMCGSSGYSSPSRYTLKKWLKKGSKVTSLGTYAFYYASGLESVPEDLDGLTSFGSISYSYTFYQCTSLKSVKFPKNVATVPSYFLYYCTGLLSAEFPDTVTGLNNYAIYSCPNLSCVTFGRSAAPTAQTYTFGYSGSQLMGYNSRNAGTNSLYVPEGATGYDAGVWTSRVQSTSYCGFTKKAIPPADVSKCAISLSQASFAETLLPCEPAVSLSAPDGTALSAGTHYTAPRYENNVFEGTGCAVVSGIAAAGWGGVARIPFQISSDGRTRVLLSCASAGDAFKFSSNQYKSGFSQYTVDWGDGVTETETGLVFYTHQYSAPGVYSVAVDPAFTGLSVNADGSMNNSVSCVRAVRMRGVTAESAGALSVLPNLVSVVMPSTLTSYAGSVIKYCPSVQFLSVEPGGQYSSVGPGKNLITKSGAVVAACAGAELEEGLGGAVNTYVMAYGNAPSVVKTPYSFNQVGSGIFAYNQQLTDAELRGSSALTATGAMAFGDCPNLSSVVLDAPFKAIAARAFMNCSSLLSIRLPATLTACAVRAFAGCVSMNEIKFDGLSAPANMNSAAFGTAAGNWTGGKQAGLHVNRVYVPEGAVGYENALSNLVDPTKCDFLSSDRGADWIYVDGRPYSSNQYINCRLSGVGDDGNVYTQYDEQWIPGNQLRSRYPRFTSLRMTGSGDFDYTVFDSRGVSSAVTGVGFPFEISAGPSVRRIRFDACRGAGGQVCLLNGTLIRMADGSEKPVEDVREGDFVATPFGPDLVVKTGSGRKPCLDVWAFSDGRELSTLNRHRFWNVELGEPMYLEAWLPGERAKAEDGTSPRLESRRRLSGDFGHSTLFTEKWNLYWAGGLLAGNRRTRLPDGFEMDESWKERKDS